MFADSKGVNWRKFGENTLFFLFIFMGLSLDPRIEPCPGTVEADFALSGARRTGLLLAGWPRFERVPASWQVGCI
jgi:hypothetical protein